MMTAKKTCSWGFIEVKFAIERPPADNAVMIRIMQAHAGILEALAHLDEPAVGGMTTETTDVGRIPSPKLNSDAKV